MLLAAIDTETTGIARSDFRDPSFPFLAALTLILYDTDKQRIQSSFNTMIQPDGWEMPPDAQEVNGLDMETLELYGIPADCALSVCHHLLTPVDLIVAHNAPFDVKILAGAYYRADMFEPLDVLLEKEAYCVMKEAKHIVQARNVKGALKYPKLAESYEFFFDRPLDNAHSANADTVAALEIYEAIQLHNAQQAASEETVQL